MRCHAWTVRKYTSGRSLQKRITEHRFVVRRGDSTNAIAVHAHSSDHRIDRDGACVLETEPHYWKRRILEAIWI